MNKTVTTASQKFLSHQPYSKGNDMITTFDDGDCYWQYHYSVIAKIENGKLFINLHGYDTRTTIQRLNTLPNVNLTIKDKVLHNNKEYFPNNEWVEICDMNLFVSSVG